jgi:NADPH:quinone reductase-like Zn-dependent oxidoreductase
MRAFVLDGYGAIADHVRLAEIADPVPVPDDVRIEIHAASLDFKIVHGDLKRVSKYQLPRPFGFDASGFAAARRVDHGADVRACRCEVRARGKVVLKVR